MVSVLNLKRKMMEYSIEEVKKTYRRTFNGVEPELEKVMTSSGQVAFENIANSDALYHDVEHTLMVTLAGQSILEGKHLLEGGVTPRDWVHFMIALLFHDIGYRKGICKNDKDNMFATGVNGTLVEIPPETTDASLGPYHIDRAKLFVHELFGKGMLWDMTTIDADLIASFIEMTRFPVPEGDSYKDTKGYPGLARAADFIGQFGDPNRLRKCPALFYEFQELGINERLGYKTPQDLRTDNSKFYWDVVHPYVQDALRYLEVTQEGKLWIANLHANVNRADLRTEDTPSH
jgi:hypothetical protein